MEYIYSFATFMFSSELISHYQTDIKSLYAFDGAYIDAIERIYNVINKEMKWTRIFEYKRK